MAIQAKHYNNAQLLVEKISQENFINLGNIAFVAAPKNDSYLSAKGINEQSTIKYLLQKTSNHWRIDFTFASATGGN